jgi:hypothetical protein
MDALQDILTVVIALCASLAFAVMAWAGRHQS